MADLTEQERDEEKALACASFTGVQHKVCEAGIAYDTFSGPLPCLPRLKPRPGFECPSCPAYQARGMEAVLARKAEIKAVLEALSAGLSPCCKAKLIEKTEGRFYTSWCSTCGKVVATSCSVRQAPEKRRKGGRRG